MKWESSDFAVGAVVVAASLIILGSFLWLSPAGADRTYPLYTEFDRIDGIGSQANVVLRGYNVGSVGAIQPQISPDGNLHFRVRMDIQARLASGDSLRLPVGTTARLMPPPVIGAGFIVLEPPAGGGPPLDPGSTIPGIRTTAIVEQMQGLTTDIGGELVTTMTTARQLMDSLTMVVSTANRAMLTTTAAIPDVIAGLREQLEVARALTGDLRTQVNTLSPAALASIDTVTLLLSDSHRLVEQLNGTLSATRPQMQGIVAQLDTTTILLAHFVRQVTARPWKALTGVEPPEGLEPPPPGPAISVGSTGDTAPDLPPLRRVPVAVPSAPDSTVGAGGG